MRGYELCSPVPYPKLQCTKDSKTKSRGELHSLSELGRDPELFDGSQHLCDERWLSLKVCKLVAAHKEHIWSARQRTVAQHFQSTFKNVLMLCNVMPSPPEFPHQLEAKWIKFHTYHYLLVDYLFPCCFKMVWSLTICKSFVLSN